MKSSYIVLGTNDMTAGVAFYDALFADTALTQVHSDHRMTYWQCPDLAFALALPFDGAPATNGNGTMVGLDVGANSDVDRLYAKALEIGGTSEGAPAQRGPYYSCYVRDLDKNKLCLFSMAV
ncbi:VOC family protein [Cognatishimia maritima]|uniref:Predicted lactoylglutathione lyase n=1 Tax=Cognatishimia maritima TaxID=870908 RepID=A0A1M5NTC5_9RHOB|nr:VOC family protein [Cognatishimia maritima]SHG92816.1 Predicted lactoylglutathione lyase [Cognatishimia maritima]